MNTNKISASEAAIREAFGRLVYTHKAHMKDYEIQSTLFVVTKWTNIILTSITSSTLLSTIFLDQQLIYISAFFSFLSLIFVIFQLSFDPVESAGQHKEVADRLWLIRDSYIELLADMKDGILTSKQVKKQRELLKEETHAIYSDSIATTTLAYWLTRKALKIGEEFSFQAKEVNDFLPKELKI